jgi:hypothetical protein
VEPLTYYGVMRGQKEFAERRHGVGAMVSLVQRRLGANDLRDELNRQSLMTGLDGWHFLDREKVWVVSGWAAMSRVAGTRERMIELQRDPRHYLQRPDVGHLGVDSSATSVTGYGARLWLNKQKGNFISNSAIGLVSPGFDVNDMGFQSRADVVNGHMGGGYRWTKPNRWRKYFHVLGAYFQSHDFGGDRLLSGVYTVTRLVFVNNLVVETRGGVYVGGVDNRRTRGGPRTVDPNGFEAGLYVGTSDTEKLVYTLDVGASGFPSTGSIYHYLSPGVTWKPVSNFSMSVGPGFERNIEDAQYVDAVHDPGNVPADFGDHHYVFARLDQKTVSANIRLNVSFTPNLSLQTFIQPLISAGRYMGFKELARSRSYEFIAYGETPPYGLEDPSFNFKSLRGNAVLRWEYRPGSTLFLVWTQRRTDSEESGDLRFGPSSRRLLDAKADNIFLAKVTYYLNL